MLNKMKLLILAVLLLPFLSFSLEQDLPPDPTAAQTQKYIDTSEDCMIVQNKKQIVMKCGDNMIFVTKDGVGIRTPNVSKSWS